MNGCVPEHSCLFLCVQDGQIQYDLAEFLVDVGNDCRYGVLVVRIVGKELVERVPVRACWWRQGV